MAPPANNPIMSGRSIWSFRHLEHQNSSIISDFLDSQEKSEEQQEQEEEILLTYSVSKKRCAPESV